MDLKTVHLLKELANRFEDSTFIKDDPVQFPLNYQYKCSQEIVGFIASWLAYGNRKAIIKACQEIFIKEMGLYTPYGYIKFGKFFKHKDSKISLYRFYNWGDFYKLCEALKAIYDKYEDMEEAVYSSYLRSRQPDDYVRAIISLFTGVKGVPQDSKSACKRINMFLRWMCRKNSPVDLGIWSCIQMSQLLIPLDTHVASTSRHLGLLRRNNNDMEAVIELTENCRQIFPNDPCKCDYALFGYGINNL